MHTRPFIYIILSLFIGNTYTKANAPQGSIEEAEFIIQKERKNELPESTRLFKKAPLPLPIEKSSIKLQYDLYDMQPSFQPLEHKVKILRAKQDMISRLYGNYLKLGHGNYYMPYIAAFLDNTRNDKYAYGLHLSHLSEGKKNYFEAYHNDIELHLKTLTEKLVYTGAVQYKGDKYPLIHSINNINNTENDPHRYHAYHQIGLHTTLYNHLPAPFNYQVDAQVIHLRNHQSIQESQEKGLMQVDYMINEIFKLKTELDLHLIQYTNPHAATLKRYISHFKPSLEVSFKDFTMQAGANLAYQNDATALSKNFDLYPELKISYAFTKLLRPYVRLSGTIQPNTWQDLIIENPWLTPSVAIRHTNQNWVVYAGVHSDLLEMLSGHVGLSVANYHNWPCFVNHPTKPREFDIKYAHSANVLNIFAELTKVSFAEALITRLQGAYFYYELGELPKAWHRPQYTLELLNTYNFYDKILLKNKCYWLGGIHALDPHTQTAISLPDVVDIGVSVEYLWNQRFSIFIDCQNILAKANNHYLHTPTSGTHILAGITYGW
ncbi:MAG: hypothetical protein BGO68_02905 [Candidatus Amoebophilus sp. 36-38]|nr:MAG: hypothetical protein BGO68_02905 [Candidatus Amoebophilus sp. 36-38]